MSIQCINRPPSSATSGLASLGRTISVISDCESRTGRGVSISSLICPVPSFGLVILLVDLLETFPSLLINSQTQPPLPASSASARRTRESTPPCAAPGSHDAAVPTAPPLFQTPAHRA